jgi:3-deoxy-manno-octulosonate cytidylyltransferase (CMP-KDO synthetase)
VGEGNFRAVIPARLDSTRLPGKVLLDIAGKPMLQHVWERAVSSGAEEVIVATDSERVASIAGSFGAHVCMTRADCRSGTDRVAEVCSKLGWNNMTPVVNVQGDAPLIPPASIRRVAGLLHRNPNASLATLCVSIKSGAEFSDRNVVKVVFDSTGRAMYFSRAGIPAGGHGQNQDSVWRGAWRHLGLYAYRPDALQRLSQTPPCALEETERLEQLRAMWLGMTIIIEADEAAHGPDVDTADDLVKVAAILRNDSIK